MFFITKEESLKLAFLKETDTFKYRIYDSLGLLIKEELCYEMIFLDKKFCS